MRRNCLLTIVVWFALIGAYAWYLRTWLEPPALFVAAFAMGTAMGAAFLMFNGARYALRDGAARSRLSRGERPEDGDLVAAVGELRPMLDPLRAPFSGRECVAYSYQIGGIPGREQVKDYAGYALTRCSVHTNYGSFLLGGFPVLEGFGIEVCGQAEAERYVAETKFTRLDNVLVVTKETLGLYAMPPPIRIDWAIGTPPSKLDGRIPIEIIVENGARVVAYGRYSARDQSIGSDRSDQGWLRLQSQEAGKIRSASAAGWSIAALMLIGAAHLILWAVMGKIS